MQRLPRPRAGAGDGSEAGTAPSATVPDAGARLRRGSRVRSRSAGRVTDEAAALPAPLLSAPSPLDSLGLYGPDAGALGTLGTVSGRGATGPRHGNQTGEGPTLLERDAGLWVSPAGLEPVKPPGTSPFESLFDSAAKPDDTPFDEADFAALAAAVRSPGALLTDERTETGDDVDKSAAAQTSETAQTAQTSDAAEDGAATGRDDGSHRPDMGGDASAPDAQDDPGRIDPLQVETAEWQPTDGEPDDIRIDLSDNPKLINRPPLPGQRERHRESRRNPEQVRPGEPDQPEQQDQPAQPEQRERPEQHRRPGRLEDLFPTASPGSGIDRNSGARADAAPDRPLLEHLPAELLGDPAGPSVTGVTSRGGQPAFVPATPGSGRRSPDTGSLPGAGALAEGLAALGAVKHVPAMRKANRTSEFPIPAAAPPVGTDAIALPRLPEALMAVVLTVVALIGSAAADASADSWVPIAGIAAVAPLSLLAPMDRRLRLLRAGLLLAAAAALPCLAAGTAPVAVLIAVSAAATYPMVLADAQARAVLGLAVVALLFPLLADALVEGPGSIVDSLAASDPERTDSRLVLLCGVLVVALIGASTVAVRRALAATAQLAVEREQAAQDVAMRIGRASATDAPSGLPNREALIRATSDALDARTAHDLEPSRDQVGVIIAEIDRFDVIADSLGAALADDIALQVARRLRSGLPAQQFVARISRHHFGLLLPHATPDSCASVARRITRLMERPILSAGRDYSVTCSVGAALRGPGLRDAGDLLQAADEASRAAASTGTSRWVLFDQAVRAEAHSRASLEIELRDAVRTGTIEAFFQPLVAIGRNEHEPTGEDRIVGAEALARWIRPDGSTVPPARFIPMADELGLGSQLGLQIADLALDSLVSWRRAGLQIDQVWVNISPAQLLDPDLPHDLAARLATRGLPPSSMVVEVSAANLSESEQTQATLSMLRSLGIAVALDDFGRSGTSLSALRKLPVSAVKLDHVLAAELGRQDAVPRSIAQLCRSLGLRVIVEGVETMMQLRGARDIDADAVQGFAIARPMPSEDVVTLLAMRLPQPDRTN